MPLPVDILPAPKSPSNHLLREPSQTPPAIVRGYPPFYLPPWPQTPSSAVSRSICSQGSWRVRTVLDGGRGQSPKARSPEEPSGHHWAETWRRGAHSRSNREEQESQGPTPSSAQSGRPPSARPPLPAPTPRPVCRAAGGQPWRAERKCRCLDVTGRDSPPVPVFTDC